MLLAGFVVAVAVALSVQGTAGFQLNTLDTSTFGAAWLDAFESPETDWVVCTGKYALCYYSSCTVDHQPSASASASGQDWFGNLTVANCPCGSYFGDFHVMINGILDESVFLATRAACPLGLLSCLRPNQAPVCDAIRNGTLYSGVESVTLVSAWSLRNATHNDNFPPSFSDCSSKPGPYAGCMTAPCFSTDSGLVCQCPVADGPFQVPPKTPCENEDGVWSASYHPMFPLPDNTTTYALIPSAECTSRLAICYEGSKEALEDVRAKDPLLCPGQNHTLLVEGSCNSWGFPVSVGNDPIFLVPIFKKHSPLAPGDLVERCEDRHATYNLTGKRALVITTSHGVLGNESCTTCKPTGVTSPEMTAPYYVFLDAGMEVTLASIKGGPIPVDPMAKFMTEWDVRFWNDVNATQALFHSVPIASLNFTSFDVVYMAGGWGASWDLGTSPTLANGISAGFKSGVILGSVCHGALGFIEARKPDGSLLVQNRTMTAVTNRQLDELGIKDLTPMHPETELEARHADYVCKHGVVTDLDQSMVVRDGSVVTGQNQNSACETAQRMLDCLTTETCEPN